MNKKLIAGAVILIGVLLIAWFYLDNGGTFPSTQNNRAVTSTNVTATSTGQTPAMLEPDPTMEQYPDHVLPAGAVSVDNYFYTYNNKVFLNSIAGTSSQPIPNADVETFKRLTNYQSVADPAIAQSCGKAGEYAFYSTSKYLYFYQIWFTPTFRHAEIRVIVDAKPETFTSLNSSSFQTNLGVLPINYEVGTSTCQYVIPGQTG